MQHRRAHAGQRELVIAEIQHGVAVDIARMRHQIGSAHKGRAASVNQLTVPLDRLGHNPTAHALEDRLEVARVLCIDRTNDQRQRARNRAGQQPRHGFLETHFHRFLLGYGYMHGFMLAVR